MEERELRGILKRIKNAIDQEPSNFQIYEDYFFVCKEEFENNQWLVIRWLKKLAVRLEKQVPLATTDEEAIKFYQLHKNVLLKLAPHDFDSYCLYIEWNREPKTRFYQNRRKQLKVLTEALQRLAEGKTKILGISLPPGVGKSTLAIFFLTWLAGRNPMHRMLTGSHSNAFTRGAYDECLRILAKNGDYLFYDVFPDAKIVSTNAKEQRIDMGESKRFETLQFTSIGSGNAGLYRATRLLYCDDLCSGVEVAFSIERLDKLWETYVTDLRQRKQGDDCAELHIATRWSLHDVIGRLERFYEGREDAEFIRIPALDGNDESNFDYPYGLGFTTEMFHEQRNILEDTMWRALYMNEPIEREGLLYDLNELRRYFELPSKEPDAILGVCDTKNRGPDYTFLPVVYQYGEDYYVVDCVCDDSLPEYTDPKLATVLLQHKVQMCRFEVNNAGGRTAEKVDRMIKEKGGITQITTLHNQANKETKIIVNSPWVKQKCLFLDESKYSPKSDYGKMMSFLGSYTTKGNNKHDDVVDGFAMLAIFAQSLVGGQVYTMKRPF